MKTETEVPGEESRESWVAVGADGAEHLFVRCKHCGQAYQSSRKVLRVSAEDDKKLKELDGFVETDLVRTAIVAIILPAVAFALVMTWWIASYPRIPLISEFLSLAVLFFAALGGVKMHSRRSEKRNVIRREILARYEAKLEDYPLTLPPKSELD